MRKTAKFLIAGALLAASSAPLVAAAAVNVDVNIGLPGFSTYVAPQPTYYYPPAVYFGASLSALAKAAVGVVLLGDGNWRRWHALGGLPM